MAISASSTWTPSLTTESPKSISPFTTTKFSSLSSLKLSGQLHRIQSGSISSASSQRAGVVTRVKAEKQTFSNLDELLENSDKLILVDFYATWCGPCQFMTPILNEVEASLNDKVQVVKIDTEKNPSTADKYRIEALPTFIIFKDGKPCDRFEGALTANQLNQRIENALKVKQ